MIGVAEVAARAVLVNNPRCFDLLSPDNNREEGTRNPITVLNTVPIDFFDDGSSDLGAAVGPIGGGTTGDIWILPGFFIISFNPADAERGFIDRSIHFDLPVVELSIADMQLVTLLHEIGHLTGVNPSHTDSNPLGQDFNTQIYVNCLPQGARYQQ